MSKRMKLGVMSWGLVFLLEIAATVIAYQTINWQAPFYLAFVSFLINLVTLIICFRWFRLGLFLAFSYVALVYLYTAPLGARWYFIDSEAKQVVEWAQTEKLTKGSYPEDLTGYVFLHPQYKEHIHYYQWSESTGGSFEVNYYVGTTSTHHYYDPKHGWIYIDD